MQLKRTKGPRGGKAGGVVPFIRRAGIAIIGGAVVSAFVVAALLNGWSFSTFQSESDLSSTVPAVSGADTASTSTPDGSSNPVGTHEEVNPGFGASGESPNHNSTETEPELDQISFTDSNFLILRSDPDRFENSTVAISGKVYEIVDQSTGAYVLMTFRIHNQAIDSDESRAVVMFQQPKLTRAVPPPIGLEDCISVQGKVRGGIGDTNSLGQTIRIPIIDSTSLQRIECIDSAMPASITLDSSLTQTYGGVTLVAERVQMSEGHLRVKISAENFEGADTVFIRERESQAEYLGKVHHNLNHLPVFGAYKIDPTLPPETKISGYMFFEPVEDFSGGPIIFRVVVEKVGISDNEKSTFILKL